MGKADNISYSSAGESDSSGSADPSVQSFSMERPNGIPEEARTSLERLLVSKTFSKAPRVQEVLKYLVDALIDGRAASVNEQIIGQIVFDRPEGYNPGEDNIVRVTMRHVRERLEEFYRAEGRDEKYIVTIPKGRFVPVLNLRQPTENTDVAPLDLQAEAHSEDAAESAPLNDTPPKTRRFPPALAWTLLLILVASNTLLAYLLFHQSNSRTEGHSKNLLSLLSAHGEQITVVVADSNLQAYRMIFNKTVSLDDYLHRSYFRSPSDFPKDSVLSGAWSYVDLTTETNLTSSIVALQIQKDAPYEVIRMKHPHDLSMRDFQHGNYVLLGGPWVNPWGQLFENRLNYRFVPLPDAPSASSIRNVNPLPSEPANFSEHQQGALTINYARVALMRNLSNDGYVLLIGATDADALEAGGRFIVNQEDLAELMRFFKVSTPRDLPSFEVVLEVQGLESIPSSVHIVAQRAVKPY